jgi:phosphoribosylanthranilate isomerase
VYLLNSERLSGELSEHGPATFSAKIKGEESSCWHVANRSRLIGWCGSASMRAMNRTRVKICGICRVEDALAAAALGADAVGLVLHRSAGRFVSMESAERILAALPPFVTPVGLFVDAPTAEIQLVTKALGLRHVQLHGNESPQAVGELRGLIVLKALSVRVTTFAKDLADWRKCIADLALTNLRGLILESPPSPGTETGGTGVVNDWQTIVAAQEAGAFAGLPPIIAAGGLRADNVGNVVRTLRPWAVDVSSGVESARREKSGVKIGAFIAAVRAADES